MVPEKTDFASRSMQGRIMAHKIVVHETNRYRNLLAFTQSGAMTALARDGKKGLHLVQMERPDLDLFDSAAGSERHEV
jgi:hypothetical protein